MRAGLAFGRSVLALPSAPWLSRCGLAYGSFCAGVVETNVPTLTHMLLKPINRRYGTYRGLIRLLLAQAESKAGTLGSLTHPALNRTRRFVFVCSGNICRSCFADTVARSLGLPSASFGLSTT